jgi:hypothetical protein
MSKESFDLAAALEDENTPAGLRKWAESVQAQNKKLADELAGHKTSQRQGAITGALQTLGVPAKVASFYPSDAEASAEAVAKWLKDNEGVFTAAPAKTDDQSGDGTETPPAQSDHSPVAADLRAAMQMVQDVTPTSGGTPSLADRAAVIDKLDMGAKGSRETLDAYERELQQMARQQQQAFYGSMQQQ